MGHQILVNLPEEIYTSLMTISQKAGRTPEELVIEGIEISVKACDKDPVEQFIGAFNSNVNDWTENHDLYLGNQQL